MDKSLSGLTGFSFDVLNKYKSESKLSRKTKVKLTSFVENLK